MVTGNKKPRLALSPLSYLLTLLVSSFLSMDVQANPQHFPNCQGVEDRVRGSLSFLLTALKILAE